jgi:hypothetical protein
VTTATATAPAGYTTGEAARLLNQPAWRLLYLIHHKRLPEVRRCGILRFWTPEDVERARGLLAAGGHAHAR